jgi:hypothetical protein
VLKLAMHRDIAAFNEVVSRAACEPLASTGGPSGRSADRIAGPWASGFYIDATV